MNTKITIDPLTRISGFLEIQVEIDKNKIVDAKAGGMLYRGFEKMLKGREPLDAIYFTERICGICSTAHAYASTVALENALNIKASETEQILRDIIHGTEFLQNHIRHFYLFTIPDYIKLEEVSSIYQCDHTDFRIPEKLTMRIQQNYIESIKYGRMAHEALAIFGGKAPHNHGIFVGGVNSNMYSNINASKIIKLKSLIREIKEFITNKMISDAYVIADYYRDYYSMGTGYGNLMSYGLYDSLTNIKNSKLNYAEPQVYIKDKLYPLDSEKISENIYSAWYESNVAESAMQHVPNYKPLDTNLSKTQGYSFIKAPRYSGYAMEVGPLARMYISGRYKRGISAMDRMLARVLEAKLITEILEEKIQQLEEIVKNKITNSPENYYIQNEAKGKGLIDTVRGALGHWINIKDKNIINYDIITPSTWNLSPVDSKGVHGVLEKSLIGTTINDIKHPVEIGRIVRTFDPCVSCATHVISDKYEPIEIRII